MDQEILKKVLDVYEMALTDEQYLQFYADYAQAHEAFLDLLLRLPLDQRHICEDYLLSSVELHHRLMVLTIESAR